MQLGGSPQRALQRKEKSPTVSPPHPVWREAGSPGTLFTSPAEVPVKLPLEELPYICRAQQERPDLCCFWTCEILTYFRMFFVPV